MSEKRLRIPACILSVFLFVIIACSTAWALPGDIDESGRVDGFDLITFSRAYGSVKGDNNWNVRADLNGDGAVNEADLAILKDYFGRTGRSQGCWVADYGQDRIVLLGSETGEVVKTLEGLNDPVALSLNIASGAIWVADKGANQIVRVEYDANGSPVLRRISGFSAPESVSVNSLDGGCWVADTGNDRLVWLADDIADGYDVTRDTGYHKVISGFLRPRSVSVSHYEGSCWVADTNNNRVVKVLADVPDGYNISTNSDFHAVLGGLIGPLSVSANYMDGTCWVADTGNDRVVLVARNGTQIIKSVEQFPSPRTVSVNPLDGSCWVGDTDSDQIIKLIDGGTAEQFRLSGFNDPVSVSVELFSGSCWVADRDNHQVVKLSAGGTELLRLDGFISPISVLSVPGEEPAFRRPPQAVASWNLVEDLEVRFDASGSTDVDGHIIRYEWDFEGDGIYDYSSSDTPIVSHTFPSAGIYNPILKVTDNDYLTDIDATQTIRLGQLTATASADPYTGTVPLNVSFTGQAIDPISGRIADYRWDFNGDGEWDYFSETSPDTSCTYSEPGVYTAVFHVQNSAGHTAIDTVVIEVYEAHPTASASANPASGDAPLTTNLVGTGNDPDGSIEMYQWDFDGDGNFDWYNLENGSTYNTYAGVSTYTPVFQVTDNTGLTGVAATRVEVNLPAAQRPTAVLSATAISGNAPLTITFSGSASSTPIGTITDYTWDFGDGESATGINVSHTYTPAGNYTATLTVTTDLGGTNSTTKVITVLAPGTPTAVASANPYTGAAPLTVTFSATGSHDDPNDPNGSIETYQWYFDDISTALFRDDMESGDSKWTPYTPWALIDSDFHSQGHSWTDSPGVDYANNADVSLTSASFDLSSASSSNALTLTFWHHYEFESGYDYGRVEISSDGGTNWTELVSFTGTKSEWTKAEVNLSAYAGEPDVRIRFRLTSDSSVSHDGWYIDDVNVRGVLFEDFTATSGTASYTYTAAGTYHPTLRVTDDEGNSATDSLTIDVNLGKPVAVASADPPSGVAPLTVNFSTDGSSDPNGSIVLYEWDFEGSFEDDMESGSAKWTAQDSWAIIDSDGHSGTHCWTDSPSGDYADYADTSLISKAFDLTSSTQVTLSFWHHYAFSYNTRGIVEISAGGSDTYTELISFSGTQNDWTEARVNLNAYAGKSDVKIRFRLNNTGYYNADGWYIDDVAVEGGIGTIDWSSNTFGNTSHTYDECGIYHPVLRVTDNDGYTSVDRVKIAVLGRPKAQIEQPIPGKSYFKQDVNFVGNGTDLDGDIISYEWDFDGDGTFDWSSSATGATLYSFSSPSTYTATFKVTDNDGLVAISSACFDIIEQGPVDVEPTADTVKGNSPLTVSFDGSARDEDGTVVRYEWDFDGNGTYDWGSAGPGQVVSFSSQYNSSNWSAANLVDGLVATSDSRGWCSGYRAAFPHEIIFSLAKEDTWNIDRIDIDPQTTESSSRWAKNFQVLVSTDGENFAAVDPGTYTLTNQAGFQSFTFTQTSAKYVKLVITSNYGDGNYTQLGEVAVYSGHLNVLSPLSASADYTYYTRDTYTAKFKATDDEGYSTTEDIQVTVFDSDFLGATGILSATSGYAPLTINFIGFGFSGYGSLDNFDDGNLDHTIWSSPVGGGNWVEEDGILKQTNNDGNASDGAIYGIYLLAGDDTWDNYSFSVDMRSTDDDTMGLIFRYQNDSQYYLFEWNRQDRTGIKHRRLLKRVSNGVEELTADDVAYESNRWYQIRVDVDGSHFAVYVDGQLVLHGNDSEYTNGGVGLWCNSNNKTYFDNAGVAHDTPSEYKWDFGDGSPLFSSNSTGAITHTYNTPGTYQATLTITDAAGSRSDSDTVDVRVLPAGVGLARAWVADRSHDKIVLLAADGKTVIKEVTGFNDPVYVEVNPSDGSCWVSDHGGGKVYRIDGTNVNDGYNVSSDSGYHQVFSGFSYPNDLDVDRRDGSCWVADRNNDRVVKLTKHIPDGYNTSCTYSPDNTSKGHDGCLYGNAKLDTGKTGFGNGLVLDGYGDYVQIPDSQDFRMNSFTMEAWIKPASFGGIRTIMGKVSQSKDFALVLNGDKISILVYSGGRKYISASEAAVADQWYHVASVYDADSGKLQLYIDGNLIAEGDYTPDTSNTDPLRIGSSYCCGEYFNGMIDDIRIWNVARTQTEINSGKDSELTGTEPGLIAYWKCNGISPVPDTLVRIYGFSNPLSVAINGTDGVFWVADNAHDKVYRFEPDVPDGYNIQSDTGYHTEIEGFYDPVHAAVNENDGTCWVADRSNHQVVRLAADGSEELARIGGFDDPTRVAVNQTDGSVWVADRDHRQVVHLSADGGLELARVSGFYNYDFGLSVDSQTGECWVTDTGSDDVKRLSPNGTQLSKKGGFYDPFDVAVISGQDSALTQNPPTASASADAYTGTTPLQVNFSGTATDDGSIVLYEWDFEGDGVFDYQSSTSENVTHTYSREGYYKPILRVTDNDGMVDYVHLPAVRVGSLWTEISANKYEGVAPLKVDFTATGFDPNGTITEYAWDFDGEGTYDATGSSVSHTFQTQGLYPVILKASGPSGITHDLAWITVSHAMPTATASVSTNAGVPPLTIHLDGQASDADGSIVMSQWDYDGDGIFDWSSRTKFDADFTYTEAGIYTPTFKVIDNDGYEAIDLKTITVNTPPEAHFTVTPLSGNEPLTVTFDASGSFDPDSGGAIVSYTWNFGDGETATGQSVSYTYMSAATYQATLTVTDDLGGTGQATQAILVRPAGTPTAVAEADPLTGTAPLTVDFTGDNSTDDYTITNYSWDFGEGYQLNENGYPTHQLFLGKWPATGSGDVTSIQTGILAHEPNTGDTFAGNTWFAAGDSDGNFDWYSLFGGGYNEYAYSHIYIYSPEEQTVRIKFGADDAARFWVNGSLAYQKTGCEGVWIDQYSFDVTLIQGWNRVLASVSQGGGGWGLAYRFTATDDTPLRLFYSLNRLDGEPDFFYSSDTTGNTSHTYTAPGIYHPVLTVTDNDGNTDTGSLTITVLVPGAPTAHAAADPTVGDNPLVVHFTGTGSDPNGQIVLYEWDFEGDGVYDWSSSESGETHHTYEDVGTYQAVLRVTDNDGYQATDTVEITAGCPPVAVPVAYPTSGPPPLRVKFDTKGTDADNTIKDFRWDFDGDGDYDWSSPISMTTEHTYNTPGTYHAKLKVTDHDGLSGSNSIEINVTVPDTPTVEALANPAFGPSPLTVNFTAYATDLDGTVTRFCWDFGSGFGDWAATPESSYTFNNPGSYQVKVKVQDNDGNEAQATANVIVMAAGAPDVEASADPSEGPASLLVHFTGKAVPAAGDEITNYEWDFDGDGTYDWVSSSTADVYHNYTECGSYRATLKVTTSNGSCGLAAVDINVTTGFKVWRGTEKFDPTTGETMPIRVAVSAPVTLTLRIVDETGTLVRTVVDNEALTPGIHEYEWDGKDENGNDVEPGVYYFIAEYESGGGKFTYDLTNTEGFERQTPNQQYQSNFDPFSGEPLDIRFDLAKPGEVSMYVFAWNWNADIRTILLKYPMTSGSKVVTWDGTDDDGNLIPTDTSYTISTSAWYLPDNAMIIEPRPILSHVIASPHYFNPAFNPYAGEARLAISFSLSKEADVQATIWDPNNKMIRQIMSEGMSAGPNTLYWDGLNSAGRLPAPGYYRVRLKAKDAAGNESQAVHSVFNLFY